MRVYKVVEVVRGNPLSAFTNGAAVVNYSEEKYAAAPAWLAKRGYFLTAFVRLKDAENFFKDMLVFSDERFELWEADGIDVKEGLPPRLDTSFLADKMFMPSDEKWPKGTVMVRKIKLIRRIKRRKFIKPRY